MKRRLLLSVAFCIILLSSCTTMVRVATTTHKQVMDSYKTKEQVIGKFGIPTSKRNDGDYEEFYYLFGVKTVTDKNASLRAMFGSSKTKNSSASASASSFGGMATGNSSGTSTTNSSGGGNANAAAQTISQEVKTYVKFTMKENNVVTWESNGVDYGIYEMVKK
jgi:outer membrane protein assembly factor BamE (lipoprotein component of BamABCDE complex)